MLASHFAMGLHVHLAAAYPTESLSEQGKPWTAQQVEIGKRP